MKTTWIILACIFSAFAKAGTITKKSTTKQMVMIDEGSDNNINKGDKVCFYNDSNKKVACGKAVKVNSGTTIVKLSPVGIKKVKKGFTTKAGGSSSSSSTDLADASTTDSSAHTKSAWSFGASYILTLMPQTKITPPARNADDTAWEESSLGLTDKLVFLGFGGEAQYTLSPSSSLAGGVRFKSINLIQVKSDYNSASDPYNLSEAKGSAFGFWLDYYFYTMSLTQSMKLDFGVGADIEMSSIEFQTIVDTDNNSNLPASTGLMKGTGSSMVLSARFPVALNFDFGSQFSLSTKLIIMFAASAMGDGPKVESGAESDGGGAIDKEYEEALGQTNAGLAVEIVPIQINYQF